MHDAVPLIVSRVSEDVVEAGPDEVFDAALARDLVDLDPPVCFVFNAEREAVDVYEGVGYVFEGGAEGRLVFCGADVEGYAGEGLEIYGVGGVWVAG